MNVIAGTRYFDSFTDFFVWAVSDREDRTYNILPDGIPDLTVDDLVAEGDVETERDPYGTGDSPDSFEVTLTDVRHESSGRPVEISALETDMLDILEQRVLDQYLADRRD